MHNGLMAEQRRMVTTGATKARLYIPLHLEMDCSGKLRAIPANPAHVTVSRECAPPGVAAPPPEGHVTLTWHSSGLAWLLALHRKCETECGYF